MTATTLTKPEPRSRQQPAARRSGGPRLAAELTERFTHAQRIDQLAIRLDMSPLRVARLIEKHLDADMLERSTLEHTAEDLALQELPLTGYELRKVRNGQSIPNARLRIAVLDWVERQNPERSARLHPDHEAPPVTLGTALAAAGFDHSQGRRFLGLAPTSGGNSKPSTAPRLPQIVNREYAARLAAVIGADPREVGL